MSDALYPWLSLAGVVLLAILCLPVAAFSKFVLELAAWTLRIALLAILAAGIYLWLRPEEMPARVSNWLDSSPTLLSLLPERSAAHFSLCAAGLIATVLLPLLAALDVARRMALHRHRVTAVVAGPVAEAVPVEPAPVAVPVQRPIDRRSAATALTTAGS